MADYGADQWRWKHGVIKGHEDDCNELERVGEQGPYALLEAAVKRIDEKDATIRRLQEYIDSLLDTIQFSATFSPPVMVIMDEIPPGFYEGEVMDEAPDTRDPDDYEDIQDYWNSLGYDSRP